MPYIKQEERTKITVRPMEGLSCPGNLNYLITLLCNDYVRKNEESYQTYNDIIGVLECAKQEIYRRKIAVYEEKKRNENGDVFK